MGVYNSDMLRYLLVALAVVSVVTLGGIGAYRMWYKQTMESLPSAVVTPTIAASGNVLFEDDFGTDKILEEAASPEASKDTHWWLNSGGQLWMRDGMAMTVQGEAQPGIKWKRLYAESSPVDTDEGKFPQNLFRLIHLEICKDCRQQVYFSVKKNNLNVSPNRNQSNGVFLMSRFQDDGDTVYYLGLRVDGSAVIKKKVDGVYWTLASAVIYPNPGYDSVANPNVLPKDTWTGMRATVRNIDGQKVSLVLEIDEDRSGNWEEALRVEDVMNDQSGVIGVGGYQGLRSDFMDVAWDDYALEGL